VAVNNSRQEGRTSLREAMSELVNDSVIRHATPRETGAGLLLADVIETPDEFVVLVDVPGLNPDAIDVSLFQGTVTIQCPGRTESVAGRYVVRERNHSPLMREFAFGQAVGGEVSASCESGVLTLRLPKSEVAKPKEIKITPR
jgi:HSP20 family protein